MGSRKGMICGRTGRGIGDRMWTCIGCVARMWHPGLGKVEEAGMGQESEFCCGPLKKRCTELLRQLHMLWGGDWAAGVGRERSGVVRVQRRRSECRGTGQSGRGWRTAV